MGIENKSVASEHVTSSSGNIDDKWCRHLYDDEEKANVHRDEMMKNGYEIIRFEKNETMKKWVGEYKKNKH